MRAELVRTLSLLRAWTSWTNAQGILAYNSNGTVLSRHANDDWLKDGPRHGTVITVTDPSAKKVIWQQRKTAGWTFRFALPLLRSLMYTMLLVC